MSALKGSDAKSYDKHLANVLRHMSEKDPKVRAKGVELEYAGLYRRHLSQTSDLALTNLYAATIRKMRGLSGLKWTKVDPSVKTILQ